MVAILSVETEWAAFARTLDDIQREQLPLATARALTSIARGAERAQRAALPSVFDKPTPFTARGPGSIAARKTDLTAIVFIRDRQAAYLRRQEEGGQRRPEKGVALVIPGQVRRNAYGNIPYRGLARAKARRDVFVGRVKGVGGFWQRDGRKLKLLAAFEASADYNPRFGYWDRLRATVWPAMAKELPAALAHALATARPR